MTAPIAPAIRFGRTPRMPCTANLPRTLNLEIGTDQAGGSHASEKAVPLDEQGLGPFRAAAQRQRSLRVSTAADEHVYGLNDFNLLLRLGALSSRLGHPIVSFAGTVMTAAALP